MLCKMTCVKRGTSGRSRGHNCHGKATLASIAALSGSYVQADKRTQSNIVNSIRQSRAISGIGFLARSAGAHGNMTTLIHRSAVSTLGRLVFLRLACRPSMISISKWKQTCGQTSRIQLTDRELLRTISTRHGQSLSAFASHLIVTLVMQQFSQRP
jgi:hypothetical protein